MKRRLLSALLALTMLLSLLPATALAAEAAQPRSGTGSIVCEVRLAETLPAFYAGNTASFTGTTYKEQLNSTAQRIYDAMWTAFADNGSAAVDVTGSVGTCPVTSITITAGGTYAPSTEQAISSWLDPLVTAAYLALLHDHPEMPWLYASEFGHQLQYSYTRASKGTDGTTYSGVKVTGVTFRLLNPVSITKSEMTGAVNAAKSAISSTGSTYDTLKSIHDYLCRTVSYDLTTAYPRNQTAASALIDRKTVCAGYSTAFKVLCDAYNIPCLLVSGTADTGSGLNTGRDGSHMWNCVRMEDGKWYAVDVTWDDQTATCYDFFLVGSASLPGMGFAQKEFSSSHIAMSTWTDSSYVSFPYPVLSTTAYKNVPLNNTAVTPGGALPVTTGGTGEDSATTAVPTAAVRNGAAFAAVSDAIGDEILTQAVENDSREVVIAPDIAGDVSRAEVTLPAATVSGIGSKTAAGLTVSTPAADVSIPNGGLSALADQGGSVTVTAEKAGNTVTLTITAGGRTVGSIPGGITLTVPHGGCTPGTVAVLIRDDGTREVVRKSVAGSDSVSIPLDGSARLEIVDNSKEFPDVPATHWAAAAVAFASGHELFQGSGDGTFNPNGSMTRGMLSAVLHNLENNPDVAANVGFTDVADGAWYADAVGWAAANGIVTGGGDGTFGAENPITREQLATMLWRYAGCPDSNGDISRFADADQISVYAGTAMRWAVENGILQGNGSGLNPTGTASRAEVAQMLRNFVENVG